MAYRSSVRWIVAAAVGTSVLAACGKDSASPDSGIFGSYTLTTVNAHPVPADVVNTTSGGLTVRVTWNAGVLDIHSDGSWSTSIDQTVTFGGTTSRAPDPRHGTYARSGNDFVFTATDGVVLTGTVVSNTLNVTADLNQLGIDAVATAVFTK